MAEGEEEVLIPQLQQEAEDEGFLQHARRRLSVFEDQARHLEGGASTSHTARFLDLLQEQRMELRQLIENMEGRLRISENRQTGLENERREDRLQVELQLGWYEIKSKQLIGARMAAQADEIQLLKKQLEEQKRKWEELESVVRSYSGRSDTHDPVRGQAVDLDVDRPQDSEDIEPGPVPLPQDIYSSNVELPPDERPTWKTVNDDKESDRRKSHRVRKIPARFLDSDSEEVLRPGRKRKKPDGSEPQEVAFADKVKNFTAGRINRNQEDEQTNEEVPACEKDGGSNGRYFLTNITAGRINIYRNQEDEQTNEEVPAFEQDRGSNGRYFLTNVTAGRIHINRNQENEQTNEEIPAFEKDGESNGRYFLRHRTRTSYNESGRDAAVDGDGDGGGSENINIMSQNQLNPEIEIEQNSTVVTVTMPTNISQRVQQNQHPVICWKSRPLAARNKINGESLLHELCANPKSTKSEILEILRTQRVKVIAWRNIDMETARDVALRHNRQDLVQTLDHWIASLINQDDPYELKVLIFSGYDVITQIKDYNGQSLLDLAFTRKHTKVESLLRVHGPDFWKMVELLHEKIVQNSREEVKQILEFGSGTLLKHTLHPRTGRSALHTAILAGHLDMVQLLLHHFRFFVEIPDFFDRLPIHYSFALHLNRMNWLYAFNDNVVMITSALVVAGASIRRLGGLEKRTPTWYFYNPEEIQRLRDELHFISPE